MRCPHLKLLDGEGRELLVARLDVLLAGYVWQGRAEHRASDALRIELVEYGSQPPKIVASETYTVADFPNDLSPDDEIADLSELAP